MLTMWLFKEKILRAGGEKWKIKTGIRMGIAHLPQFLRADYTPHQIMASFSVSELPCSDPSWPTWRWLVDHKPSRHIHTKPSHSQAHWSHTSGIKRSSVRQKNRWITSMDRQSQTPEQLDLRWDKVHSWTCGPQPERKTNKQPDRPVPPRETTKQACPPNRPLCQLDRQMDF